MIDYALWLITAVILPATGFGAGIGLVIVLMWRHRDRLLFQKRIEEKEKEMQRRERELRDREYYMERLKANLIKKYNMKKKAWLKEIEALKKKNNWLNMWRKNPGRAKRMKKIDKTLDPDVPVPETGDRGDLFD